MIEGIASALGTDAYHLGFWVGRGILVLGALFLALIVLTALAGIISGIMGE